MIQDAKTAKRALELMEQADKLLIESLELVRSRCSSEEYSRYRGGMSQVVGRLFFEVMEPIYRQHPSLPPDTPQDFLDDGRKASSRTSANPNNGSESRLEMDEA
jgi:hypothetical protein